MPHPSLAVLSSILQPVRNLQIVDIGANPIDGAPPYLPLLEAELAELTGFEPQASALETLLALNRPAERYLPYAVGDGSEGELKVCVASGMTSLLEPNMDTLAHFEFLRPLSEVTERVPLKTVRLDDIAEIERLDYLKIDIQGSELSVFRHGTNRLAQALAVHTEVSFVPLYHGQPVFGDIDAELRSQGFIPHCFASVKNWVIAPTVISGDPRRPLNQLLEADIVYVRDFMKPDGMDDEQLKLLALIAHGAYGSFDLANRCVYLLEQRGTLAAGSQETYLRSLAAG